MLNRIRPRAVCAKDQDVWQTCGRRLSVDRCSNSRKSRATQAFLCGSTGEEQCGMDVLDFARAGKGIDGGRRRGVGKARCHEEVGFADAVVSASLSVYMYFRM